MAEDADLMRSISQRARAGVDVRILLGGPESPHMQRRGDEEGISDAMAAKIRNALVLCRPLQAAGVEIRLHPTLLYNSIFRADNEMLVKRHVYGIAAAYAPVLHLRHHGEPDDVFFNTYTDSFERVWSTARQLVA